MLNLLDLFSGIGGFSLGLERTGSFKTVAFCEIDHAATRVLKRHWPNVPVHADVSAITAKEVNERIDVLSAGFPCQDISLAGTGAGLDGERSGLFYQVIRILREFKEAGRPIKYALLENVSALRTRGLDEVLRAFAEIGYVCEWHCIPASYVGAWHRRDRIWLLAYPHSEYAQGRTQEPIFRQSYLQVKPSRGFAKWLGRSYLPVTRFLRSLNGLSGAVDRLKQCGNAVVPQIPELIGNAILDHHRRTNDSNS